MELPFLRIRAVILDVYSTMLTVGPAPADAEARWQALYREQVHREAPWTRTAFAAACSQVIARRHAEARARGIPWPEIHWPSVVTELIPDLKDSANGRLETFIDRQIQLGRTVGMEPETATTLALLHQRGVPLGIASNAQAYTLRELGRPWRAMAWISNLSSGPVFLVLQERIQQTGSPCVSAPDPALGIPGHSARAVPHGGRPRGQ